ncbi:SDR family NAD(P)-dependent oxidoreductase [Pseudohalocynthiibacter aestuariivivens]|uniref:SDR family NAD(P)-dependent oxidoreductase n=2 Tax=Pseudohalocynthiibacter aestuariivivens TaxID=1591409 RepID=A0ABV5JDA3_9RHOB|nr:MULTISPECIES: SDR family oxidoreductase [Pseudohalocynthiibacter]MBS9717080.1 SDR family oxidoreductase [Pseudohalocynthiibacter aestuariivivens]MCK0103996.1 SDR family oxidoreductase [Pseudohalocynthiibacter sp. F2068]
MADESPIPGLFDLKGRVACVTGASSGLGRRAATLLALAGASVVGVARRADQLADWQANVNGDTAVIPHDLSDRDSLPELAERAADPFGQPDILVHAAGINTREAADAVTPEGWDVTLSLNLTAPFFLSQHLVSGMKEKGWGRIVNFASLQMTRAFPGGIAYGASKGGIGQLTRAMAEVWSPHGINVNAIGPGFIRTELTAPVFNDPERAAQNATQTCIGRNGEPEDLDGPLLFLCSNASAYVTGQVLMVDGGYTAK